MNKEELIDYFAKSLKPLWPDWNISEAELQQWLKALKWFDKSVVDQAVSEFYASTHNRGKIPYLSRIVTNCRTLQAKLRPAEKAEDICDFALIKTLDGDIDRPLQVTTFWRTSTKGNPTEQAILAEAQRMATAHSDMYGGIWISIIQPTPETLRGFARKIALYQEEILI